MLKNFCRCATGASNGTTTVLLDSSSAFDLVDHKVIIQRMQSEFRLSGYVIEWLKSYISKRNFKCKVAGEFSTVYSLGCGVPQGSVLGPQFFSSYIEPVSHIITAL